MNTLTLRSFSIARGIKQAHIAAALGVSRQTVSRWFQGTEDLNLYAKHAENLARYLGVTVETLSQPLPILADPKERKKWETDLLWDRLYPNLESFVAGVVRGQKPALARLVQVCGLYGAGKIAGKMVWKKFPDYKKWIHPAYRKQSEILWQMAQTL